MSLASFRVRRPALRRNQADRVALLARGSAPTHRMWFMNAFWGLFADPGGRALTGRRNPLLAAELERLGTPLDQVCVPGAQAMLVCRAESGQCPDSGESP